MGFCGDFPAGNPAVTRRSGYSWCGAWCNASTTRVRQVAVLPAQGKSFLGRAQGNRLVFIGLFYRSILGNCIWIPIFWCNNIRKLVSLLVLHDQTHDVNKTMSNMKPIMQQQISTTKPIWNYINTGSINHYIYTHISLCQDQ